MNKQRTDIRGWGQAVAAAAVLLAAAQLAIAESTDGNEGGLQLDRGDRICLIGNTLAERMQHFGYFETLLHRQLAEHEVVVRNLAVPADEVALRPRSFNFGSPHEHLEQQRADVVLAFFGFNESFAGAEGVEAFREDVAAFIEETRQQRYNGESAPRLVLVSPIAAEPREDERLASADELNARIERYTEAMGAVAAEHDVPFVDLFKPTQQMYADADEPLTINGVHLNEAGYRSLAPILLNGLVGVNESPAIDERLRQEILDRNVCFFDSYRMVNGYYVYGGRSQLTHEPDPSWTNADEMEREREILRGMAANRDERIWQLARGEDVPAQVDDSNLPERFHIETNYTEPYEYRYGEDALASFTLPEGYEINLFASEQEFPELANPVAVKFDAEGRLWVSTMPLFPQRRPDQPRQGKLLVFEDTDGDGRADDMTVFADGLHVVTGFELGDGGVYVADQHNLLFLKDTDGDGRADSRKLALQGFGTADAHHANSAFRWGPDGSLYFQEGVFLRSQVETPWGPVRMRDGGVWRYRPQEDRLEVFIDYTFPNPWGHVFGRWGMNIVSDGTGPDAYHAGMLSVNKRASIVDGDQLDAEWGDNLPPHFSVGVRPNAGAALVSSRHFPEDAQGQFLITNVVGFHGIKAFDLVEDGSAVNVEPVRDLLVSNDPSFRPIDLAFGPDGALYVSDFYSILIGHMTHSMRDPNRDHEHGRIYRITRNDKPLLDPEPIAGRSVAELLELLKAPEDGTAYRARRELRKHDDAALFAALESWEQQLDPEHPQYERHLLEVLWLNHSRNRLRQDPLERLLEADDFRARAAATRALRHQLDAVDDPYALIEARIYDDHPRVRLEAVVAAGFLDDPSAAADLAAAVENLPMDRYLDYALTTTLEALEEAEQE